jgi:hypothetical protein
MPLLRQLPGRRKHLVYESQKGKTETDKKTETSKIKRECLFSGIYLNHENTWSTNYRKVMLVKHVWWYFGETSPLVTYIEQEMLTVILTEMNRQRWVVTQRETQTDRQNSHANASF